jgi:hypothetical protein
MKLKALVWLGLLLSAWLGVHTSNAQSVISASPVYVLAPRNIVMHHDTPAHRALACARCHERRALGTAGREELRPSEAQCTGCHEVQREQASAERCGFCHVGFDPAHSSAPEARPALLSRVRFAHAKHQSATCDSCHGQGGAVDTNALPSMQSCLGCHDKQRRLACNGCHEALPSGLLRVRFPEGQLVPQGSWLGMAHDADFAVRHRWVAADEGAVCATCHTERECSACHDSTRKPRSIHPNDYLALHPQDAQRNATRCTSCHANANFCLACHARLGVSQLSAPDVRSPRRFHPPDSQWIRGPMLHAREAERSLATCVSCHAERDCVACHGAKAVGVGLHSPHPAGFAASCARDFANNGRACLLCHRSTDALLRACR